MKHGRRAQQKRRELRNKIVEHPDSEYSKDGLIGNSIEDLKRILDEFSLTKEEEDEINSSAEPIDKES